MARQEDNALVDAHCGCPGFMDAAEVIYKNANVWADLSGIFVGDAAAFAALARRGRLQRTVERLHEALEYADRPDRFLYGSDWPLAPMAAYRAFLAPCWTIRGGGRSGPPTPARCLAGERTAESCKSFVEVADGGQKTAGLAITEQVSLFPRSGQRHVQQGAFFQFARRSLHGVGGVHRDG